MPVGHAAGGHTFYLGSSTVGACSGKCKNLNQTAGVADTTTSQQIHHTAGKYQIEPDISSTTTGTPSTSAPSGYAWVDNATLGGATIPSGTWTFNITTVASGGTGTPVGNLWITVWNCNTTSLGTCTFLFKNWDNTTNVVGTTTTKYTFTTTVGPFSNANFLAIEYWISYATTGGGGWVVTETTVSSASSVFAPFGIAYSQSLSGSLSIVGSEAKRWIKGFSDSIISTSSLMEKNSIFRSLSCTLASASGLTEKNSFFRSLTDSIILTMKMMFTSTQASKTTSISCTLQNGVATYCTLNPSSTFTMASGLARMSSFSRTLSGSLSLSGSETIGLSRTLSASMTIGSSLSEQSSLFRSITGSLGSAPIFVEHTSLFRSLSSSWAFTSSFSEHTSLLRSLGASLGLTTSFAKQTSLFRSLSGSLGSATSFGEHIAFFRSVSSSLNLSGSETKALAQTLSSSFGLASS